MSQTCITAEGESGKDPEGILSPGGKSLIDKLVAYHPRANKCFFTTSIDWKLPGTMGKHSRNEI